LFFENDWTLDLGVINLCNLLFEYFAEIFMLFFYFKPFSFCDCEPFNFLDALPNEERLFVEDAVIAAKG
jgi:hypothetical protein